MESPTISRVGLGQGCWLEALVDEWGGPFPTLRPRLSFVRSPRTSRTTRPVRTAWRLAVGGCSNRSEIGSTCAAPCRSPLRRRDTAPARGRASPCRTVPPPAGTDAAAAPARLAGTFRSVSMVFPFVMRCGLLPNGDVGRPGRAKEGSAPGYSPNAQIVSHPGEEQIMSDRNSIAGPAPSPGTPTNTKTASLSSQLSIPPLSQTETEKRGHIRRTKLRGLRHCSWSPSW